MNKIALVTGGNRGLGLGTCQELAKQGLTVILTSRDKNGQKIADEMSNKGLSVYYLQLDADDLDSIRTSVDWVSQKFGKLDILINNAAILLDKEKKADKKILTKTFETNVIGPYLLIEGLAPLMQKNNYGRIVNVSSQAGQFAQMNTQYPAYSISKAALNAVTAYYARKFAGTNILVNSVCPGWVKTDMGGSNATRSVEEGVQTILWAATLPDHSPTGNFFFDKNKIAW